MDIPEDPAATVDWKLVAENLQKENTRLEVDLKELANQREQLTAIAQRQQQQMEGILQALDRTLVFSHKLVIGRGQQNG